MLHPCKQATVGLRLRVRQFLEDEDEISRFEFEKTPDSATEYLVTVGCDLLAAFS
jgi:hypothetical protein